MNATSLSPRNWLRFRLRTLLIGVTVIATGLGLLMPSARQRRTAAWLREVRAEIGYTKPSGPEWLSDWLGIDATSDLVRVIHRGDAKGSTPLSDDDLPRLLSCPKLTYLQLHGETITDASLPHLARLKRLQTLYLYDTQVTEAAAALFDELPELERIGFGEHLVQVSREPNRTSVLIGARPHEAWPTVPRARANQPARPISFLGRLRGLAPIKRLAIRGFSGEPRFVYWNFALPAYEYDYAWAVADLEELVVEGAVVSGAEVRRMMAFPKLLTTMKDRWPKLKLSDENIVERAVEAMDRDPDAASILCFVLTNHWNSILRGRAARAMRIVPYVASEAAIVEAVAALTEALEDKSYCSEKTECGEGVYPDSVRQYAAFALRYYGADAKPAVKRLARLVGETAAPDFDVCTTAAETLGHIGPEASDAAPELVSAFLRMKSTRTSGLANSAK